MTKNFKIFTSIITAIMLSLFLNTSKSSFVYSSSNLLSLLKDRLILDGFNNEKINYFYNNPETYFDADKVARYFCHSEAKLDYSQFTDDSSIKNAFAYMLTHNGSLLRAEKKYGVSKEIITAILLVETRLGKYVGEYKIFNILSNMAILMEKEARRIVWNHLPVECKISRETFERKANKKSVWAYKELKTFIKYTEQQKN